MSIKDREIKIGQKKEIKIYYSQIFNKTPIMSKILFPRNVKKGLFNMNMNIGPLSISLVQVFLLMVGLGAGLGVFQITSSGGGNKTMGLIFAIPVVLLFVFIAFFEISEMGLPSFLAKLARNYFFDSNIKYQTQYTRIIKPHEVLLHRIRTTKKKDKIETKELIINEEEIEKIKNGGLL